MAREEFRRLRPVDCSGGGAESDAVFMLIHSARERRISDEFSLFAFAFFSDYEGRRGSLSRDISLFSLELGGGEGKTNKQTEHEKRNENSNIHTR